MNEKNVSPSLKPAPSEPQEPYRLFAYCFIITTIGAGILLGLNWKRLGKPEWVLRTISISIAIPIIVIISTLGWMFFLSNNMKNLPFQFVISLPMLMYGIGIGYLWGLARLQNGAYKKFKAAGFDGLREFQYDVDGAMFFGGIAALVIALVGIFVFPLLD